MNFLRCAGPSPTSSFLICHLFSKNILSRRCAVKKYDSLCKQNTILAPARSHLCAWLRLCSAGRDISNFLLTLAELPAGNLKFQPVGVRAQRGFAVSNKGRVCLKGCQRSWLMHCLTTHRDIFSFHLLGRKLTLGRRCHIELWQSPASVGQPGRLRNLVQGDALSVYAARQRLMKHPG
jgi:hypothetical protein